MNLEKSSQNTREKIVLSIYIIYTIAMTFVAVLFRWGSWIIPVIWAGLAGCIIMFAKKVKTYEYRANLTAAMMWMNFSIYILHSDDFIGSLSTMTAMIILLAIYCVPKISYTGAAVYTCHLIYHLVFLRDIGFGLSQSGIQIFLRIGSVYVALYVAYILMKTQVESNAVMIENMDAIKLAQQSKDDFMANMSHEIRTPINTVCGISEIVLREELSEKAREGVYDIQTAGRQLQSIVSDILDFSELSSGKMEIVPDTYNITSTLNDILNMAVAKAEGREIELIVDCDADIPSGLVGDEPKIRRAIMNVLDNAIKFTEKGGVLLTVSFRKESYGGNLIVTVQDTGIGIKEEQLDILFGSFSQGDAKRNRRAGGMGLGLPIAKVIVNRMGGFISAKSVYGQGTEIRMIFPQKVDQTQPIAALNSKKELKVMLYLDVDKYKNALVRDGYVKTIGHIVQQLSVNFRKVKSLAECKRMAEREDYDFLFVSWKEYSEDKAYFEELSNRVNVVLILERDHKESVMGSRLLCVYKPFYVLTIASVLNGEYAEHIGRNAARNVRFIAPDAKVLVVDDNLMNLKVVEGLLRPYKVKVFVAESGKEALGKIEEEQFDLIFMDHMMPEMDGIDTFHRIRRKHGQYFQNVPVVALTANAIGGAREMFLQEGFADYVSKPIELSALERVLYKFLPDAKIMKSYDKAEDACEVSADNGKAQDCEADGNGKDSIHIKGVDTELGIRYSGGRLEDYLEVIRTYYDIGNSKKENIRESLNAKDWKNYTILVHAVKSTSLGIGAADLSEMAKELEAAGKKEDISYIEAHTEEMLSLYDEILSAVAADKTVFPEGIQKKEHKTDIAALEEISKEELEKSLNQLDEKINGFDQEESLSALHELSAFRYGDRALADMLSAVSEKVNDFDYMGAQEELENLRRNKL